MTTGGGKQFGNAAGVYVRILTQGDRCQVEAEDLHGAQQAAQAATGKECAAIGFEGLGQHLEIVAQGLSRGIRLGLGNGVTVRLEVVEMLGRRRQPGVDAGQRLAVGFIDPLRRLVGGGGGEGK